MKKVFIVLVFVLIASSYIYAEKITAEIVESQTLQNNPSIAKAQHDLYIAKQSLYSSFSSFLPAIRFLNSVTQRRGGFYETRMTEDAGKTVRMGAKYYSYGLESKMSLFSGFSQYNATKALSAKLKAAQESYTRAVSNAICDAYSAYVNLMYTYEAIDLYKQIKHRRTENRDLVKLRYHSGNADMGSLRRIEADVKMIEYELEKTQRAIETDSVALLVAIGRNDDVTILETDERIVVDKEIISKPDFGNLIIKIPDFLLAKYTLDYAKAMNWSNKGQWLPTIDFIGEINCHRYDKNKILNENKSWTTTLNLSYLLFSGGKRFFDTKSSAAQEKIAAEDFRNTKNKLKLNAIQVYNNWVNDYEILTVGNFYLESCKLQTDIAKRKYINGLISYEDWYNIEDSYIIYQKNMLNFRQRAILSKINWIRFLGKVLIKDKEDK
ncbi:MAG: TolC family protein [Endomicrobium sp.]|jgi:outer membrane protein TolC|nr:TolC family protein [Endomicrobium sp.]